MWKKLFLIWICAAMVLSRAAWVSAGDLPQGKWWRAPGVQKLLELTEAEKDKLEELFLNGHLRMIDLKAQLEKEILKLESSLEEEAFDEEAVLKQHERVERARQAIAAERFKFLIEVRKLLGPDRFQLLKEKYRHFQKNRKLDGERRPGRPDHS